MADVNKTVDILYNARSAKAIKETEKLAKETDKLDKNVKNVNQDFQDQGGILDKAAKGATAYITGFAGIATVSLAMRTITEDIKEQVMEASKLQKALQELQFLQGTALSKETRETVTRLAPLVGRDPSDVARFLTLLESGTASSLTPAQRADLSRQALETSITAPESDLTTIGKLFAVTSNATGIRDFNQIQNVLREGGKQAFTTIGDFAGAFSDPLAALSAKDVPFGEATGIFAQSTQSAGANVAKGASRITTSFLKLTDPATPKAAEIFKKYGLGSNFTENIFTLANSDITSSEITDLVGIDNNAFISNFLSASEGPGGGEFQKVLDATNAAAATKRDVTSEEIAVLFENDPIAAGNFRLSQAIARRTAIRATGPGTAEELNNEAFIIELDAKLEERGVDAIDRAILTNAAKLSRSLGLGPEVGADIALQVVSQQTKSQVESFGAGLPASTPLPNEPGGISGPGTTIINGDIINGTKNVGEPNEDPDPNNGGAR